MAILSQLVIFLTAWKVSPSLGHLLCKVTAQDNESAPLVHTNTGWVRGCELDGGGSAFTVPFAEPPLGDLRFRAPRPVITPWDGVFDGTQFATPCPQLGETDTEDVKLIGQEDCLYLSVHVPPPTAQLPSDQETETTRPLLPVMFWIYGGAFVLGDSYEFGWYDPKTFVQKNDDVIVVTANYRVNVFGFLAHEELKEEDAADRSVPLAEGSTGNVGLRDQRLAMQWVQENIRHFGGDPNQVTIFGESAGGMSVCAHVANGVASAGLFHAAIMESGSCDSPELFLRGDDAMLFGADYAALLWGCGGDQKGGGARDQGGRRRTTASSSVSSSSSSSSSSFLECARNKTTQELMYGFIKAFKPVDDDTRAHFRYLPPLFPLIPFVAVVDGSVEGVPSMPLHSMQAAAAATSATAAAASVASRTPPVSSSSPAPATREENDDDGTVVRAMPIPMIMGTNKDEGTIFVPFMKTIVNNVSSVVPQKMTPADLVMAIEQIICTPSFAGPDCDPWTVFSEYGNCSAYDAIDACTAVVLRDYIFLCPTRRAAAAMANAEDESSKAWVYQFKYASEWLDMQSDLGNYHTSELYFLWDNPWPFIRNESSPLASHVHQFSPDDEAMSATFSSYWTSLALTGDPNPGASASPLHKLSPGGLKASTQRATAATAAEEVPFWPGVEAGAPAEDMPHMQLEQPPSASKSLEAEVCDFWDAFLGYAL